MIFQFLLWGLPVSIHWTTIFLFLLFFLDAFLYLKINIKGKRPLGYTVASIFCVTLIILSILGHEIGHAIVAKFFGFTMTSAGINGLYAYVSNGLSMTTIAPYQEFLIALAGPSTNFLLALVGAPLIYLLGNSLFESSLRYFSVMNIRLGRMNLWPIIALDGGWILDSIFHATIGRPSWTVYLSSIISGLFILYLFSKKKGHKELENLIEKIP